jgi:O-antigen/teichoic acid export membrane protein
VTDARSASGTSRATGGGIGNLIADVKGALFRKRAAPRLLNSIVLFLLARCGGIIFGLGVMLVGARALSRSDFSTFLIALTLVVLGTTLSEAGLNSVLMRESIKKPQDEADLVVWARRFRWVTGFIATFVVTITSFFLVASGPAQLAVILFSLALPALAPTVLYSVLQRRYRTGRIALLMLLQNAQWFVAVVVLAWLDAPLVAYGVAYAVNSLLYAGEVTAAARYAIARGKTRIGVRDGWKRLKHAVPLGLNAVLALSYAKVDGVLLYGLQGPGRSAGYVAAYRLLDVMSVIPASVGLVFAPMFNYALQNDSGPAVAVRWTRSAILVSCPVVVLGEVLAEPLVHLVFGSNYSDAVLLFRLLLPSFIFICLEWAFTSLGVALRLVKRQVQVSVAALAFNVAANLILIPVWGATACSVTTLVTEIVIVWLSWYIVRSAMSGPIWPPLKDLVKLGAVLAAVSWPALVIPPIPATVVCAVMYVGGVMLVRLVSRDDYFITLADPD